MSQDEKSVDTVIDLLVDEQSSFLMNTEDSDTIPTPQNFSLSRIEKVRNFLNFLWYTRMLASFATNGSTVQCVDSFSLTDFREDIKKIDVPTLIIHGDSDKTVPIEASSDRTARMIPGARYLVYDGAPHGLFYTHRERLNQDLVAFITSVKPVFSTDLIAANATSVGR
jgi:pimeloyl-ACP methyl ester carboxylesterase